MGLMERAVVWVFELDVFKALVGGNKAIADDLYLRLARHCLEIRVKDRILLWAAVAVAVRVAARIKGLGQRILRLRADLGIWEDENRVLIQRVLDGLNLLGVAAERIKVHRARDQAAKVRVERTAGGPGVWAGERLGDRSGQRSQSQSGHGAGLQRLLLPEVVVLVVVVGVRVPVLCSRARGCGRSSLVYFFSLLIYIHIYGRGGCPARGGRPGGRAPGQGPRRRRGVCPRARQRARPTPAAITAARPQCVRSAALRGQPLAGGAWAGLQPQPHASRGGDAAGAHDKQAGGRRACPRAARVALRAIDRKDPPAAHPRAKSSQPAGLGKLHRTDGGSRQAAELGRS